MAVIAVASVPLLEHLPQVLGFILGEGEKVPNFTPGSGSLLSSGRPASRRHRPRRHLTLVVDGEGVDQGLFIATGGRIFFFRRYIGEHGRFRLRYGSWQLKAEGSEKGQK